MIRKFSILLVILLLVGCEYNQNIITNNTPELQDTEIKNIILEDSGITENEINSYKVTKEKDTIKVSFSTNNKEYLYTLSAENGDIWELNIKVAH